MQLDDKELLKKYKCPIKKNPEFTVYWRRLLPSVANRDNFAEYHLKNLEILCTLYLEYDRMTQIIQEDGFSYFSSGRYGEQRKTVPEVTERAKVLAEIRQYSRLLGILLNKDVNLTDPQDDNEWIK